MSRRNLLCPVVYFSVCAFRHKISLYKCWKLAKVAKRVSNSIKVTIMVAVSIFGESVIFSHFNDFSALWILHFHHSMRHTL